MSTKIKKFFAMFGTAVAAIGVFVTSASAQVTSGTATAAILDGLDTGWGDLIELLKAFVSKPISLFLSLVGLAVIVYIIRRYRKG